MELNISYKALSYKIKQYRISPRSRKLWVGRFSTSILARGELSDKS